MRAKNLDSIFAQRPFQVGLFGEGLYTGGGGGRLVKDGNKRFKKSLDYFLDTILRLKFFAAYKNTT